MAGDCRGAATRAGVGHTAREEVNARTKRSAYKKSAFVFSAMGKDDREKRLEKRGRVCGRRDEQLAAGTEDYCSERS